ncbi:MAG: hypothetical protein I8H66_01800 [Sphingobacteriia bacterium]|nr:hypothetical protein [Sphingobacteriia bacterium]
MKKLFFIAVMLVTGFANAQSRYDGAMEKGLAQLKEAKTPAEMLTVSAFFERVADAEKDKWLPFYYAARTNILGGWMDPKADKDKSAEKSKELIAKAEALEPNNAEIYCLKQQVAVQQLTVDAMSRWQTYGAVAAEAIAKAKAADPENPRPYLLEGQYQLNVPEAFGGGKAVAKKLLERSLTLFNNYKPASPFHPDWGKELAEKTLAACQ